MVPDCLGDSRGASGGWPAVLAHQAILLEKLAGGQAALFPGFHPSAGPGRGWERPDSARLAADGAAAGSGDGPGPHFGEGSVRRGASFDLGQPGAVRVGRSGSRRGLRFDLGSTYVPMGREHSLGRSGVAARRRDERLVDAGRGGDPGNPVRHEKDRAFPADSSVRECWP